MNEVKITIPYYKTLQLRHVVLDYNGTIAKDGQLKEEVRSLLIALSETYKVHVITSDTFGTVKKQLQTFNVTIKVLASDDHTMEKHAYITTLGSALCVAVGNGNNDAQMLESAVLGIALVGDEGCSTQTLIKSDIVCNAIEDALGLLLNPKRLTATLRK